MYLVLPHIHVPNKKLVFSIYTIFIVYSRTFQDNLFQYYISPLLDNLTLREYFSIPDKNNNA